MPVEPSAKRPPSFWNDVEKQAFLDAFKVSLLTLLFLFSVVGKRVFSLSYLFWLGFLRQECI